MSERPVVVNTWLILITAGVCAGAALASTWQPAAGVTVGGTGARAQPFDLGTAVAGTVSLRFGGGRITGKIVAMNGDGLTIQSDIGTDTGALQTVLWSRVAAVSGPAGATFASQFAPMAEGLWRVEARANRGDADGAELLYDKLEAAGTLAPLSGPSLRASLRTVTNMRLARGYVTGAVRSYVQSLAATGTLTDEATAGSKAWGSLTDPGSDGGLGPIAQAIDSETGLCPNLPPVLSLHLSGGGIAALAEWPKWTEYAAMPGPAGEVVRWYEAETIAAAGGRPGLLDGQLPIADPNAAATAGPEVLTRMVVQAARGNPEQRKAARTWLQKRLAAESAKARGTEARGDSKATGTRVGEEGPVERSWQEAWCRLGLGRSLLAEADAGEHRRGMLELLHVPAEFAQRLPVAAAVALADVAAELERQGDLGTAQALRADLRQLIPGNGVEAESRATPAAGAANSTASGAGPTTTEPKDPETKK